MAIKDLQDKLVLVTGAASGIGRATALAFARAGAHLIATDLNLAALASLQVDIEQLGRRCRTLQLDVSDEAAVRELATLLPRLGGVPHVLVNNAGIARLGAFLEDDLANWRRLLDVNLMGVVHLCRHLVPLMKAAGGQRQVLNVASAAGIYPAPSMPAYAASKAAVMAFSEALRLELGGSSVGISTVCPGVINTPIFKNPSLAAASFPAERIQKLSEHYQRQGCSPEVVATDMVAAARSGRQLVLTGPSAGLLYWVNKLSPSLLRSLMLRLAPRMGYL
ncbi:SDR family NAD(P)-dependent oxidoreductase [Pelomonas sp. SE-A7]|uniref:SDR family NAD(P)-dependent oxidoreductase n=1 Tax=Pelomonas sp. SE-A7 TaxID=3054953 RepID=UPI00259D0082|nr:SDR family NAD(P)-dependent oxidoreductase [Pelomonas sp. SE-A7]MDM4765052.1 SDR family NAD(P)-dependent oxidoreductase [Pelomonas sp. SE-A7]